MNSLAASLRSAAASALPAGAFLRRDRGEALFVTDAPRRCPAGDWPQKLAAAGFICLRRDNLAALSPGAAWLCALEAQFPAPPDPFSASLLRFAGQLPDAESLALFALGARVLDGASDDGRFDRLLRQRAAVCLRLNRTEPQSRGGGLYACALLRTIIEEASQ